MKCQAVQHSDRMVCNQCNRAWDVNDPDQPACLLSDIGIGDIIGRDVGRDEGTQISAWEVIGFYQCGPTSAESKTRVIIRRVT